MHRKSLQGSKATGSLRRCRRGPRHAARAFYSTMQDVADITSCNVHLTWSSNAANPHSRNSRLITRSFSARHWEELLRVLACSDMTLRQVVQRWPGIGDVSVAEVMNRLLCLKRLLPRCNVASMVALQPQMFLARTPDQLEAQVGSAYDIIQRDLPVTYVDAMIQERPAILFIDIGCLPKAVEQLQDVIAYPTDPATLSNLLWAVKQ
ncbi:g2322 [Coccomyxa elongata]